MLNFSMANSDLPYWVEEWDAGDRRLERLIAASDNLVVAPGAFAAAAAEYPRARLTLRQQARVIEKKVRNPGAPAATGVIER